MCLTASGTIYELYIAVMYCKSNVRKVKNSNISVKALFNLTTVAQKY